MRIVAVIPARYASSRFPGKPLATVGGLPMVVRVHRAVSISPLFDRTIVATDDERIGQACDAHGVPWVLTSPRHPTGTDRVAEAAQDADVIVNVQGDEPMLSAEVVEAAVRPLREGVDGTIQVTNLCTPIHDAAELVDTNVIKVVLNRRQDAVYLSRQPIPYPRSRGRVRYLKQVCVYGFRHEALARFASLPQGPLELAEGIELLRCIEYGIPVRFVEVDSRSVAVDTPEDLALVNALIAQ